MQKNEDEIDNLVNTLRIFSEDIKMEFGLPRCGVLIMKRGKVAKSEEISMPNGKMKNIEEGGYKHFLILEADGIKHKEMKEQIRKEYIRRARNILKSKLNRGHQFKSSFHCKIWSRNHKLNQDGT